MDGDREDPVLGSGLHLDHGKAGCYVDETMCTMEEPSETQERRTQTVPTALSYLLPDSTRVCVIAR